MTPRLTRLIRARARLAAFARAYRTDAGGATAVEFAMVALPLLFLLFSILELAMIFLISTTLENATYNAARTVRTGAFQGAAGSQTQDQLKLDFKTRVCAGVTWLGTNCTSKVYVDVRTIGTFTNPTVPDPIKVVGATKSFDESAVTISPGGPGEIVLVRAFYQWTLLTPFLTGGLERLSGGISLITASSVFRNEPYS